jgi:hypothetical protein
MTDSPITWKVVRITRSVEASGLSYQEAVTLRDDLRQANDGEPGVEFSVAHDAFPTAHVDGTP